jgi:hypothetical protein
MSDPEIFLKETGNPKNKLRISLSTYNDQKLFNARFYYEDKEGELKPTRKGISVKRNHYLDIIETISKHNDAISDFLETGALNDELKDISAQKNIAFDTNKSVNTIETTIAPSPDKAFSEVNYEGSLAKLSLNSRNKYVNHYKDNDQNIKLLEELAVALDISLSLIKDDESNQVQHALDRLFNEFNRQLNKLVTGR